MCDLKIYITYCFNLGYLFNLFDANDPKISFWVNLQTTYADVHESCYIDELVYEEMKVAY